MAQGSEPLGDVANQFLFENDRVKVWNLVLEPGEASPWHIHHMDYITIVVDPGSLIRESEDGSREELRYPAGEVHFRKAHGAHRVTNTGHARYRNTLVELK